MSQSLVKKRKKKGFTLIELIIVLAIIAIIAAIAIPNFVKVRQESRRKADIQSCETIRKITLTLLADDKIAPDDTFVVAGDNAPVEVTKTGATDANKKTLTEYFKEVKKPQQDGATKYTVKIDKDGNVTVETEKVKVNGVKPEDKTSPAED